LHSKQAPASMIQKLKAFFGQHNINQRGNLHKNSIKLKAIILYVPNYSFDISSFTHDNVKDVCTHWTCKIPIKHEFLLKTITIPGKKLWVSKSCQTLLKFVNARAAGTSNLQGQINFNKKNKMTIFYLFMQNRHNGPS